MSSDKVIGTHSGAFQADEALGVWMLRRLEQYRGAKVVRSRDLATLEPLSIVIDVGGVYDHAKQRYDHHQRGFFETFDGEIGVAKGPEDATGLFKTKLSAAGLVYKHYGKEILTVLHPALKGEPVQLDWVYNKMYVDFMEAIDGNDNGVEVADECRYKDNSTLPNRVHRLNSRWNAASVPGAEEGPSEDDRFQLASDLCGKEFGEVLEYIVECELPARVLVEEALLARHDVDASGEVIIFTTGGCPWKTHLYELEREHKVETLTNAN